MWVRREEFNPQPLKPGEENCSPQQVTNPNFAATVQAKPLIPLEQLTGNAQWYDILPHLAKVCSRILVFGPKSTGKSTTAKILMGDAYRITMHQRMSVEELCGSWLLVEGSMVKQYGVVAKAMLEGKPLIIEEIDRLSLEVESMTYAILDNDPHLTMIWGEVVKPVSGFRVIMTTNEPPTCLPGPVQDRIDCVLYADLPHPDAYPADSSPAEIEVSHRFYKQITKPVVIMDPTPRKLRVFKQLLRAKVPATVAAKVVYCDSAPELASTIANIQSTR
jgi:hypothetical protein